MKYLMKRESKNASQPRMIACQEYTCTNTCTGECFNRCLFECTIGCSYAYNSAR